ncbi:hypothetical protein [Streptomyces sp. NPDC019937]|uniref:hypothetical protein n=1 Tax=Streptomyces sp. NPDC019937 TaxID=3154787 RepID=UPI0033C6CB1F
MDDLDARIVAAAKKRSRAEAAFNRADADLRELLVEARAVGKGPSHMAKLTGFTREWVAKIAPDPAKTRKIRIVRSKSTDQAAEPRES